MAFFDDLGQKLTQTSQSAVKKTKDVAETMRLNNAITAEERKIEGFYRELGRTYYENCADTEDPLFQGIVAEIRSSQAAIQEMRETVARLKGLITCPSCGRGQPVGASFCNSCGTKLPEPPSPQPANSAVCPSCGAAVQEGMLFCNSCGTKLSNSPAPPPPSGAVCPSCGTVMQEGMLFCTNCGTKLILPEPAQNDTTPAPPESGESQGPGGPISLKNEEQ